MTSPRYILTPFAMASFLAVLISISVILFLLPSIKRRTSRYLSTMMASITWYSLFTGIEYAAVDLSNKVLWTNVEYIAVLITPVLFLFNTFDFAHKDNWLTRKRMAAFFIVPLITYFLALTNDSHKLIWTSITLSNDGNNLSHLEHGPVFWIGVVGYSYLLVIIGASILIREGIRYLRPFRIQALLILISAVTPLIGNIFYLFNFFTIRGYDPTSALFAISGAIYTLGIFRFKLLNFTPLAFSQLIGDLQDSVIYLDSNSGLVYFNKTAGDLMKTKNIAFLLDGNGGIPKIGTELPFISKIMGDKSEKIIRVPGTNQFFKIKANPMVDDHGQFMGTVFMLYDETATAMAQVTKEQSEANKERLSSIYFELSEKLEEIEDGFDNLRIHINNTDQKLALENLVDLRSALRTIDRDIRQTVLDLSSQNIVQKSFSNSVHEYVEEYKLLSGKKVNIRFPRVSIDNILSQAAFSTVFLLLQEALYLIQKYTTTNIVVIYLTVDEAHLDLMITSDGEVISNELSKFSELIKATTGRERGVNKFFDCRFGDDQGVQFHIRFDINPQLSQIPNLIGLRVVLADQHQLFMDGLIPLLSEIGVNVLATANTLTSALSEFEQLKPDLILVDPFFVGFVSEKFIQTIRQKGISTKIVLLGNMPDDAMLLKLMDEEFDGFLLKNRSVLQLAESLDLIINGTKQISPELTNRMMQAGDQQDSIRQKAAIQQLAMARLNPKQIEILQLLLGGKVYKEIAISLSMTESSIKYHIDRCMTLLGVQNRNELIKFLYEIGLSAKR